MNILTLKPECVKPKRGMKMRADDQESANETQKERGKLI